LSVNRSYYNEAEDRWVNRPIAAKWPRWSIARKRPEDATKLRAELDMAKHGNGLILTEGD
jgi:hypothetical protein